MTGVIRRVTAVSLIFIVLSAACVEGFAVSSLLNGFSSSSIRVINTSADSLKCAGRITASKYLLNTGENVSLRLTEDSATRSFMGRATKHNISAEYLYSGIKKYLIRIADNEFDSSEIRYCFEKPGIYTADGYMTFCWRTNDGKVTEGFPKYYYRTVFFSSPEIKVTDLNGDSGETVTAEEPETEPELFGKVTHTDKWEKNRRVYNAYCREHGKSAMLRSVDTYWSGEKLILSATAEGKVLPNIIKAGISGTEYSTDLVRSASGWEGSLFDKSMIGRWGRSGPEQLTVVFSGIIDGKMCTDTVVITVDDTVDYWLMHRKE